jgi:hypothetical protein
MVISRPSSPSLSSTSGTTHAAPVPTHTFYYKLLTYKHLYIYLYLNNNNTTIIYLINLIPSALFSKPVINNNSLTTNNSPHTIYHSREYNTYSQHFLYLSTSK